MGAERLIARRFDFCCGQADVEAETKEAAPEAVSSGAVRAAPSMEARVSSEGAPIRPSSPRFPMTMEGADAPSESDGGAAYPLLEFIPGTASLFDFDNAYSVTRVWVSCIIIMFLTTSVDGLSQLWL